MRRNLIILGGRIAPSLVLTSVFAAGCGQGIAAKTSAIASSTPLVPQVSGPDPLFGYQWHLKNSGTNPGSIANEDVNVTSVWNAGNKGDSAVIAIVDDGMDMTHEDLYPNVLTNQCYNYVTGLTDVSSDKANHGTAVSGVAAARDLNSLGGRGVAPHAQLVGYNVLENPTTANIADAMTRAAAQIWISSNSWGAPDCTGQVMGPDSSWNLSIETGLTTGRNGKGTVYFWAAGNGADDSPWGCNGGLGAQIDNSNYDGQANYHGVIAVGAIGDNGKKAGYSEKGANLWVVSHSVGDTRNGIITTDITGTAGYNEAQQYSGYTDTQNYTNTFGGTSSATPLAAGVAALMLTANPNLGWRDVKLILAQSARKNSPTDTDWVNNASAFGYHINHRFGFGAVDAAAAVGLAKNWTNVGAQVKYAPSAVTVGQSIPVGSAAGTSSVITVAHSGISKIEYIDITVTESGNTRAGDLEITLTSPGGTPSVLAEQHVCYAASGGGATVCPSYTAWRFGSARQLGESADGSWTLKMIDKANTGTAATFNSWGLTFYGTAQ